MTIFYLPNQCIYTCSGIDPSELNLHPSVLNLRFESDEDEPSSDLNEDTPSDLDGDEPSCNECDPVLVAHLNKVKVNDDHHETTQINEMSRCLANIAKLEVDHDMNLAFLTHFIRKQDNTLKEVFKCLKSMTRCLKTSHESNERRLANLETMLHIDVSGSIAVSVDSDKSGQKQLGSISKRKESSSAQLSFKSEERSQLPPYASDTSMSGKKCLQVNA